MAREAIADDAHPRCSYAITAAVEEAPDAVVDLLFDVNALRSKTMFHGPPKFDEKTKLCAHVQNNGSVEASAFKYFQSNYAMK